MKNTKHIQEFIKTNKNVSGIYAIICTKTWRSYIGSSIDIGTRVYNHFRSLKKNEHSNTRLQEDFNKFYVLDFYVEIVELVSKDLLLETEDKYLLNGCNLYNVILKRIQPNSTRHHQFVLNGENCPWSKINWEVVNFLRDKYLNEERSVTKLSKMTADKFHLDVDFRSVHKIVNNQIWVDSNYNPLSTKMNRINKDIVVYIRELGKNYNGTNIQIKLEREFGIKPNVATISNILRNRTWYDPNFLPIKYKQESRKHIKLNSSIAEEIRDLNKQSLHNIEIIRYLKQKYKITISSSVISNVVHNKIWIPCKYQKSI